jgi:hypothetical protein
MNETAMTAGCVVLLIDESSAMSARAAGAEQPLAAQTATAVNALLNQMAAGPNVPIAVVGYHADANGTSNIGGRLGGSAAGRGFVPLQDLLAVPLRVETRIRKLPTGPMLPPREEPVAFPIWYEPQSGASGPQIAAFEHVKSLIGDWLARHSGAPALVIHVCGGASSDGNPHQAVEAVQALGENVHVFHAHLGTAANVPSTLYPANRAYLPMGAIRDTFDRTSPLPALLVAHLKQIPLIINPGARGLIANAKLVDLIRMFGLVKETTRTWPVSYDLVGTPVADVPLHVPAPQAGEQGSTRAAETTTAESFSSAPSLPSSPATEIDSARLLALLVDRSVADPFNVDPKNAYSRLQERANELLTKLALKPDANLHVAMTIYGLDALGLPEIRTGFDAALAGRTIVPSNELEAGAMRRESTVEQIPNGVGGLIEVPREKLTFLELDPTRSCSPLPAFEAVKSTLDTWSSEHPATNKPPIVLHLTRGGQAESDLREGVGLVKDAAVYHLVVTEEPHPSLAYPPSAEEIEDPNVRLLAELSSPLADDFADNPAVQPGARGLVVNGKFECLL